MKAINFKRCFLTLMLTFSFVAPQMPAIGFAKDKDAKATDAKADTKKSDDDSDLPTDLFPVDTIVTNKTVPVVAPTTPIKNTGTKPLVGGGTGTTPKMDAAKVPDAYACPTFDQGANKDLMLAIDALNKEVGSSNACKNDASASAVQANTQTIQNSVQNLEKMMGATDPSTISLPDLETNVTGAINATQNLANMLSSNTFLNSSCGRQTMSTGKTLLALTDIINGLSPYALFAVSMNAALVPALPYVVGGIALFSGISILAKTIQSQTINMDDPTLRKAVLQNTCQYVKVAKKVRFMQLAQSGQINKITEELQNNVNKYTATFSQPSRELYSLLKYKDTASKNLAPLITQYTSDRKAVLDLDQQIAQNSDDLMLCTLSRELVNWAQDGKSFPASVINNLELTNKSVRTGSMLQVNAMHSLHTTAMQRVVQYADRAVTDDTAVKSCAQAGRSWMAGLHQSLVITSNLITNERKSIETELAQNPGYNAWKYQYDRIQIEKQTVTQVQTAMEVLARDESIVDRSELAQRMVNLRSGLFGTPGRWISARPPVLEWIVHTKSAHDMAISSFVKSWNNLYEGAWGMTRTGQDSFSIPQKDTKRLTPTEFNEIAIQDIKEAKDLINLNLTSLPAGSASNKLACQQLQSAWLDWSAALDHLGAIKYFCNMIDEVLDSKMDTSILNYCRGNVQLNGQVYALSTVDAANAVLTKKGYSAQASIISAKLKELQCAMPDISVMQ